MLKCPQKADSNVLFHIHVQSCCFPFLFGLSPTADWSKMGPLAYVSNMEAVFVLIASGRFLGALPDHYAKTWLEKEDLRVLRADKFHWVSKFYLATRQESARRRAVHLFIQDIMQTMEEARALASAGLA